MKLIDKDTLVAEIENIKSIEFNEGTPSDNYACMALDMVKEVIDTLEAKEVNLEEEICSFFSKNPIPYEHITDWPLLKNCAIHFFELGLKAQKGE